MQLVRDDDDRIVLWDSMRDKVYGPAEVLETKPLSVFFGTRGDRLTDPLRPGGK